MLGTTLDKIGKDTGKPKKYSNEIKKPKPAHRMTRGQIEGMTDPRNCKATLNQGRFSAIMEISSFVKIKYQTAVQAA